MSKLKQLPLALFCLLLFIGFSACVEDEEPPISTFSLSSDVIEAEGVESTITVQVSAPEGQEWKLDQIYNKWIKASPQGGVGSGQIAITVSENTLWMYRSGTVIVRSNGNKYPIKVNQKDGINTPPTQPGLTAPADKANVTGIFPHFMWEASEDENLDEVSYVVSVSKDQKEWLPSDTVKRAELKQFVPLEMNTGYYWKVTAVDSRGAVKESDIRYFTTGSGEYHMDGSYWKYTADPTMTGPVPLIFTGDGFTPDQYEVGGLFDRKIDEGIEAFFNIEPYRSYRHYFTVYKVAAHSKESGITRYLRTEEHLIEKVNTVFNTYYLGDGYQNGTTMKTNTQKVYNYARKIPGITTAVLNNTTVVLVANYHVYSGTCWIDYEGRSVSIVPTCDSSQPFTYAMTMYHEAGGHGFGQLADEYMFYPERPATPNDIANIRTWSTNGRSANIDVTGDRDKVKWKHFLGVAGYEYVSIYGRAQFTTGVWMPEPMSCMNNMAPPFNAPSREAIVKRIMKNAGETYSFELFKQIDVRPSKAILQKSAAQRPISPINHTPPQYTKDEIPVLLP